MQNHYNLVYREEEREMMPTLKVGAITSIFSLPLAVLVLFFFFILILFFFFPFLILLIPSTSALAPSRGPRSHAVLSHAPREDAPSALITICA